MRQCSLLETSFNSPKPFKTKCLHVDDGNHPRSGKNVTCMARTYADHSNAIKAIEKTEKYALEGKKKKNATRTIVS